MSSKINLQTCEYACKSSIFQDNQLIYMKNIKSTDGSWSMMDAEILDMYQYDYESKEVKDLQKTSW